MICCSHSSTSALRWRKSSLEIFMGIRCWIVFVSVPWIAIRMIKRSYNHLFFIMGLPMPVKMTMMILNQAIRLYLEVMVQNLNQVWKFGQINKYENSTRRVDANYKIPLQVHFVPYTHHTPWNNYIQFCCVHESLTNSPKSSHKDQVFMSFHIVVYSII